MKDLSVLCTKESSEEGSWLEILDMDYETKIGMSILVLGPDSKAAIKIADEDQRTAIRKMADAAVKKNSSAKEDDETTEEASIRRACAVVKTWKSSDDSPLTLGGKEFPYSSDNAKFLFENSPHIRNQVLMFYQNRANFTKLGSQNSAPQSEAK